MVERIFVLPGNGGTASLSASVTNIDTIKTDDYPALVAFAKEHDINLVIPGPEAPLVDGIEAFFRAAGIRCFGPSKEAAAMEGSKTFAKDFMQRHNIPTAQYRTFNDHQQAKEYVDSVDHGIVLKASGLAAGKGVIIPNTKEETYAALEEIMLKKTFGAAGDEIVIEEYLEGDELSILAFSDGYTVKSLPAAQDHKRIYDGDQGPNTGGMGCYAPTRIASQSLLQQIHTEILQPTIDGMRKERCPFVGMLFTGLMVTRNGPMVLEYNVRFGDPETQTVLPLLGDEADLAEVMLACTGGWLDALTLQVRSQFAATVVVASGGYPGGYAKGVEMSLSAVPHGVMVFHAGTIVRDSALLTSGGRVLAATGVADSLEEAVRRAYEGVESIKFKDMHYRKDIAHRAFKPSQTRDKSLTYAAAGVSIDAGNKLVRKIKNAVRSTKRSGADSEIGGFGGVFDLSAAGFGNGPLLIGAIDGVGTKLDIAQALRKHDTLGIDLVAMNVNDLVVQGAEPLFFLDCYSCGKLNVDKAAAFVEGVAEGCRRAGCALIGGETAEMPGVYSDDGYDVVGAAVGAVRGKRVLPHTDAMTEGDVLLALKSSGVHSNGFSLVRRVIREQGLEYGDPAPWDTQNSIGLSLLTPTRIYVKPLLELVRRDLVLGMSHITGGGLLENIPRMLPSHLAAKVDVGARHLPAVFAWLKKAGGLDAVEVARTFNAGVGMVLVVPEAKAKDAVAELERAGESVYRIGRLVERKDGPACILHNLASWS